MLTNLAVIITKTKTPYSSRKAFNENSIEVSLCFLCTSQNQNFKHTLPTKCHSLIILKLVVHYHLATRVLQASTEIQGNTVAHKSYQVLKSHLNHVRYMDSSLHIYMVGPWLYGPRSSGTSIIQY